jgi:enediyne polyketide synthase
MQASFVEGHGTGTPVGDPIELKAVNKVLRSFVTGHEDIATEKYLGMTSVKSLLGHCKAAAGQFPIT